MAQLVRAPPCHGGGRGFESRLGRSGSLAQLGEHLPYKQRVTGSSPVTSTFFMQKIIPPAKCGEGLFIANSEEKYRKRNGGNSMQSNCETCMYFGYDEEFEEYFCEVNLDEDEMEKFLTDSFQGGCPYYRLEDEYRTVRKQM